MPEGARRRVPKHSAPHPILATPRLRLRQFRVEDNDAMHACFANPEAMRFWDSPVHTKRAETERAVQRFVHCTPSSYRVWAVADARTDGCLGMVNYHDRHSRARRVTIGYMIDPAHQRRGIATEAVSALLDFCFGELGVRRIQAFVHPENAGSRRLVERFGFRCEGLLRDNLRVGTIWRDDMQYALLESDRGDRRGRGEGAV
jgi:ribosomal-protein-alanine N-acetyltransferase